MCQICRIFRLSSQRMKSWASENQGAIYPYSIPLLGYFSHVTTLVQQVEAFNQPEPARYLARHCVVQCLTMYSICVVACEPQSPTGRGFTIFKTLYLVAWCCVVHCLTMYYLCVVVCETTEHVPLNYWVKNQQGHRVCWMSTSVCIVFTFSPFVPPNDISKYTQCPSSFFILERYLVQIMLSHTVRERKRKQIANESRGSKWNDNVPGARTQQNKPDQKIRTTSRRTIHLYLFFRYIYRVEYGLGSGEGEI